MKYIALLSALQHCNSA